MLHEQILLHAISDINNEVSATYDRTAPLVLNTNAVNMTLDSLNLPPRQGRIWVLDLFCFTITNDQS